MTISLHKDNRLFKWLFSAMLFISLSLSGVFFYYDNFIIGITLLIIPLIITFLGIAISRPMVSMVTLFFANYFAIGIARYIPGPWGLSVDCLLLLTWIAVFFSQFNIKVKWGKAWNGLTIAALIWFIYALLQLLNPESVSKIAWFYAMRGVSLYMLLIVPLVFVLFNQPKHLNKMLNLWAWFTLIAVIKGLLQKFVGTDPWESYWLATIGGKTHILSQGLRIFSFFSDAATYGGSMGFSGVVFSILALRSQKKNKRYFYGFIAIAAFYGMLISGTRGAIAIPFAGYAIYAILSKKIRIIIIGSLLLCSVFTFLKFSTFGNSIYEIRRFREALNPDNPSLVVRKENQILLKEYLASRPFGGGIGSAGNWGLRFSPDTFLAKTPTDSWYVQILAEQGSVGLFLHLGILLYIMIKSAYMIFFVLRKPEFINKATALYAGIFGIMVASYGSGALGQMPNGLIVYMSMAFLFLIPEWDKESC